LAAGCAPTTVRIDSRQAFAACAEGAARGHFELVDGAVCGDEQTWWVVWCGGVEMEAGFGRRGRGRCSCSCEVTGESDGSVVVGAVD